MDHAMSFQEKQLGNQTYYVFGFALLPARLFRSSGAV